MPVASIPKVRDYGGAPVYDYTVPGYGIKTKAIKDSSGQEWYETQGGQWRNAATRAVSGTMPTWQQAAATPPAAPAPTYGPAVTPTDQAGFDAASEQHRLAGTQMTPTEAAKYGIPATSYSNLYKDTAWYDMYGNPTAAAPDHVKTAAQSQTLFPEADTTPLSAGTPQQVSIPAVQQQTAPTVATANYDSLGQYQAPEQQSVDSRDYTRPVQDDALYQWQLSEGQKGLDKLMAARGLTNSGAEIQAHSDLISKLTAEETERQRQIAENTAQRTFQSGQNEADRALKVQLEDKSNQLQVAITNAEQSNNFALAEALRKQKEELDALQLKLDAQTANQGTTQKYDEAQLGADLALRGIQSDYDKNASNTLLDLLKTSETAQTATSNQNFDRLFRVLQLMTQQNPLNAVTSGTGSLANIYSQIGQSLASALGSEVPSGPDYSNVDLGGIEAANRNTQGWSNLLGGVVANLLNQAR